MREDLQITAFLNDLGTDGAQQASDRLIPLVYHELRQVAKNYMRREGPSHTLQATALVNEAYLKICGPQKLDWRSRTHFFAASAQAMRRILVDHARSKATEKRGGDRQRIELDEALALSSRCDEDVLALDEALNTLSKMDERLTKIVELRFFAGLTVLEVAEALDLSQSTVESDWRIARAWLRRELSEEDGP